MAKKSRTIPFKADLDPRALEDFVAAPERRRAGEGSHGDEPAARLRSEREEKSDPTPEKASEPVEDRADDRADEMGRRGDSASRREAADSEDAPSTSARSKDTRSKDEKEAGSSRKSTRRATRRATRGSAGGRAERTLDPRTEVDPEALARLIDPDSPRVQFGFKMPEPLKERLLDYRAATGREMQELVILGTALALLRVEERFGAIPERKEVKVSRHLRAEDLL